MPGMLGHLLVDQLAFYWEAHLWPRLAGLTDEEYLWEPVPGCMTVRRDAAGAWALDPAQDEDEAPRFSTIAWRLVHIGQNMGMRTRTFFPHGKDARDEPGPDMFDPGMLPADVPGTAAEALEFLEREFKAWHGAIAGLDDERLWAPLGPRGSFFATEPMAGLVTHVSREVMHHGGEIGVLRDLYRDGYAR